MSDFKNANILITGGLGFIGSNLALSLVEQGANLTLVDSLIPEYGGNLFNIEPFKENVTVNISDVRDEHAMKYLIQGKDYLFNLAGQTSHLDSMHNPYPDLEINARAQLSILEACRKHNTAVRIVFASTRQVYGAPESLPVDERHPLKPVDVNGINKIAGEGYHLLYNNVYGIKTSVLRLTNTYGPRMRVKDARQTFLGIWIKRLLEGEKILVYGDGKQIRDFNYVDDVVNAMLLCAKAEDAVGQVFNLGADDPANLKTVAETMIESSGRGSYEITPFPKELKSIDIGDYYGDYRKLRSKLGWSPRTSLRSGLKLTIDYYEKHLSKYL
jgi:UDP-glucose 4-epimerase